MGGFEKCGRCGSNVTHLHTGGDANIPLPGVCSACEFVLTSAARVKRDAALKAEIAREIARTGPAPPTPGVAMEGGD